MEAISTDRIYWAVEFVERKEGDIDKLQDTEFYLKAEVDEVIAKLKDKCQMHDKYKRCLAMARYCRSVWSAIIFIHEGHGAEHYMKWENRWMKLAEKFKNKEV